MDDSPLKKLPPELRNSIYELVLIRDTPIAVKHVKKTSSPLRTDQPTRQITANKPTALLQTCRQISEESSAMFYGGNIFHVRLDDNTIYPTAKSTRPTSYVLRGHLNRDRITKSMRSSLLRHVVITREVIFKVESNVTASIKGSCGDAAAWAIRIWKEAPACKVELHLSWTALGPTSYGNVILNMDNFKASLNDAVQSLQESAKQYETSHDPVAALTWEALSLALDTIYMAMEVRELKAQAAKDIYEVLKYVEVSKAVTLAVAKTGRSLCSSRLDRWRWTIKGFILWAFIRIYLEPYVRYQVWRRRERRDKRRDGRVWSAMRKAWKR